jgi:sulfotransferase family protein
MATSPTKTPAPAGREAERGALPNLITIGAQKCGTSGLHFYLSLHPEIWMSRPKELNFFIEERNWPRGEGWYRNHFDAEARVRGESSPNYTAYPQHMGVPERMASVVPDARLIYLVRDPLERIAAHWVHNYAKRRERGDLRETLTHPQTSYLNRSQYHMQLQQFLRFYEREQILVIEQNDLRDHREETLRTIFEFVGVDAGFTHPQFHEVRHQTARKQRASRLGVRLEKASRSPRGRAIPPVMWLAADRLLPLRKPIERPDVREALGEDVLRVLREDAERFTQLVGRDFDHWSIWKP